MKFKPGDKVRFLNALGGGVVMKEINEFMVSVAIEDGFEIPTLVSELVLIDSAGKSGDLFLRSGEQPAVADAKPANTEPERTDKIIIRSASVATPSGIYLAWAPQDQQQILTGMLDIYLINNTLQDILYAFFIKNSEKDYSGIDYGSIAPRSKTVIESIVRDDIGMWAGGVVQIIFYSDESEKVMMPVSTAFRVKGSQFFNESAYHEFSLLTDRKAIVFTICELNRVPSTVEQALIEKEHPDQIPDKARQFRVNAIIDQHRTAPGEAEVDLHISALRDSYDRLSAHEILTIQIGQFERMLESAIAFQYRKVVFIHGVGNGALKQALIGRLQEYSNIEFRSASFAKYGNGAIELILH